MKFGLFANNLLHYTIFFKIFEKDTTNLRGGRQEKMQMQWRTIEVAPEWGPARGRN